MFYCPVTKRDDWAISLVSISLEGFKYEKTFVYKNTDGTGAASIRSEARSIILPRNTWEQFLNVLNEKGRICNKQDDSVLIKCSDTIFFNYPDIVFDLCGNRAILNPVDYLEVKENYALLHIQIYDGSNKLISCILGNIFMKKYYTVFDLSHNKIGLALATMTNVDMSRWRWNSNPRLANLLLIGLIILLIIVF